MNVVAPKDAKILLLARSRPAGAELQTAVRAADWKLAHLGLITTQPAPMSAPMAHALALAKAADWRLFVSPASVLATTALAPEFRAWPGRNAAVGPQTAALIDAACIRPAAGEGAMALLALLPARLDGQHIAIFAAPDGLRLLHDALAARGARVQAVPVYRRARAHLSAAEAQICLNASAAFAGSVAFLEALMAARRGVPLLIFAPGPRIAAHARALGCDAALCADQSDAALIRQFRAGQW